MLRDVVYYRLAFESLTSYERRRYEHISPSPDEWEKAQTLLPFLKKFYDLTEILSGTSYPTANLFIKSFCEIKIMLNGWCSSTDPTISEMANVMIVKFDKYWKKSNVALVVANVLDPRFKTRIVEFYLRKLYGNSFQVELDKFNNVLEKMYHRYAAASPSSKSTSSTAPSAAAQIIDSLDDELDNYINHNDIHGISEETTELDRYLIEPKWKVTKKMRIYLMYYHIGNIRKMNILPSPNLLVMCWPCKHQLLLLNLHLVLIRGNGSTSIIQRRKIQ
jgi:hypothetical protein